MKIVICGAGIVGSAIASHLAAEQNDVTVIDSDQVRVQRVTERADVAAVIGTASHPDVLAQAGLADAELLIAVTDSDEVNMVACQVAHRLFSTPMRIARVRSAAYLGQQADGSHASDYFHIDHIISPELEVASAAGRQLQLPGAFDVKDMGGGHVKLVGVKCEENCPILATPLRHLTSLFPDLVMTILAIIRGNKVIVPRDGQDELQPSDRVYFVSKAEHVSRAMAAFGHYEVESSSVVIAGGGNIGLMLARALEAGGTTKARLIELDKEQARELAQELPHTSIMCGNALEADILKEAGVATTETFVSVSDDDEVNILSSLLAKRMGAKHTVALVNMPGFVPLISTLGVDAVINPPQITVSSVLEHVRRGRIHDVHSVVEDLGEVLEAEALATAPLVGQALRESKIPKGVSVGAVIRGDEVIAPRGDTVINAGDKVILFARHGKSKQAENILTVKFNYFQ